MTGPTEEDRQKAREVAQAGLPYHINHMEQAIAQALADVRDAAAEDELKRRENRITELQARVEELQNEIHEWEKSDEAGPVFTDIIDEQKQSIADLEEQLKQAAKIIDLYFAPWGAAKGAEWEFLTGDQPFSPEVALRMIQRILGEAAAENPSKGEK